MELDPEMAYTLLDLKRAVRQRSSCPAFMNAANQAQCALYGLTAALQLRFCLLLQGKLILLITNSDYQYTERMMSFAYDRYLKAEGMQWRDLFDMVSCRASPLRLASAVLYYRPSRQCSAYRQLAECRCRLASQVTTSDLAASVRR